MCIFLHDFLHLYRIKEAVLHDFNIGSFSRFGGRVNEWLVPDFRDSEVFWSPLHRSRISDTSQSAKRRHIPEERRPDGEQAQALKDVWSSLPPTVWQNGISAAS